MRGSMSFEARRSAAQMFLDEQEPATLEFVSYLEDQGSPPELTHHIDKYAATSHTPYCIYIWFHDAR